MPTTESTEILARKELLLNSGYFVDSHCHLDSVSELSTKLQQAKSSGIHQFLVPGIQYDQWPAILGLNEKQVFCALGTHPWYVNNPKQESQRLLEAVKRHRPIAVGEIGLDFYNHPTSPRPDKNTQLESFSLQLAIAEQFNLPVIVHCVKAHNEVLEALKKFPKVRGVVHAFSGSEQIANQYHRIGFFLGAGPLMLRSKKLSSVFRSVPLENILLETDAPFMREKVSRESNPLMDLLSVAEKLADIKKLDLSKVAEATTRNFNELFNR